MVSEVFIVRDDSRRSNFIGDAVENMDLVGEWGTKTSNTLFGGSSSLSGSSSGGIPLPFPTDQDLSFSFEFSGQSFSVWGSAPGRRSVPGRKGNDPGLDASYIVELDRVEHVVAYEPSSALRSLQWYQSPTLDEGQHSVKFTNLSAPQGVDFILISPGATTALHKEILVVGDNHPDVVYNGSGWDSVDGSDDDSAPMLNGTHVTKSIGDSLDFTFIGTRMQMYGCRTGNFSLSYTIDNGTSQGKDIKVSEDAEPMSPHLILFDTSTLRSGTHSVNVEFTAGSGLCIDYILYKPSFRTLAETRPILPQVTPSSVTASQIPESSSHPPTTTTSPTREPRAPETSSPTQLSSKAVRIGPILGGIFGPLAFIGLVALLLWLRRRHQQRAHYLRPTVSIFAFTDDVEHARSPQANATREDTPSLAVGPQSRRKLGADVSRSLSPSPPQPESEMERLRREVERLEWENAHLSAVPPPAYTDSGRAMS